MYICGNVKIGVVKNSDWEILAKYGITPDNLTLDGYLDLYGTAITALPDNLTVVRDLDFEGTGITVLPSNLTVGNNLCLRDTAITAIPDDLNVDGRLHLEGTAITNYPVVYNCGNWNRTIYLDLKDKSIVRIGCFRGTKSEAIEAVRKRYTGSDADDYIAKIEQLFNMKF